MTRHGIVAGCLFLAGCAVGGAASQLAVTNASAQAGPARASLWQYTCVSPENQQTPTQVANELGTHGWELVAVIPATTLRTDSLCFKRPRS